MFKKFLLTLAIILLIVVGFGYYFYTDAQKPISDDKTLEIIEVKSGVGLNEVINQLEKDGFIKNALVTKFIAKQNNIVETYKGKFQISKSMTPKEILSIISDKSKIYIEYIEIKILPGKWAKDYALEIENKTGIKKEEVLKTWNDLEYLNELIKEYNVLTDEILNEQTRVKLEGYFYPETYKIDKEKLSLKLITKTILDPTEKFYQENKALFDKNELSIHKIFNLASMIQYEATSKKARPEYGDFNEQQLVASVFLNRLKSNMKLQSSVTVCYALYEFDNDWKKCERSITIDSPYNTYKHEGLPIGPVTNPTNSALMAVLDPIKSDYLFFVADVYDNTGTYFSKTYAEHLVLQKKLLGGR